jgi:hypothetical protein
MRGTDRVARGRCFRGVEQPLGQGRAGNGAWFGTPGLLQRWLAAIRRATRVRRRHLTLVK